MSVRERIEAERETPDAVEDVPDSYMKEVAGVYAEIMKRAGGIVHSIAADEQEFIAYWTYNARPDAGRERVRRCTRYCEEQIEVAASRFVVDHVRPHLQQRGHDTYEMEVSRGTCDGVYDYLEFHFAPGTTQMDRRVDAVHASVYFIASSYAEWVMDESEAEYVAQGGAEVIDG